MSVLPATSTLACPYGVEWPKVTLVTPSFNQGRYLEAAIQSVLHQDYPSLEYVIVDGGSQDDSVDIIRRYSASLAYWVSEPDGGQADAINKGFRAATGDYLGWINSDDLLYPGAIRRVIEAFRADPSAELVYGDVDQGRSVEEARPLLGRAIPFKHMLRTLQVPVPQQGSLWRRSVIERIGGLDPRWHVVLDREFFTRAAERCQLRYLPGTLGFFRHHPASKSVHGKTHWLEELPAMYREYFKRADLPDELRRLQRETMGVVFLTRASIALDCGHPLTAASSVITALLHDPVALLRTDMRARAIARFRASAL